MANIALFEDSHGTINEVVDALHGSGHEITARAERLPQALEVLHSFLQEEVAIDVLLLDGWLGDEQHPGLKFRHTQPPDPTAKPRKTLFGRVKPPQPHEIIITNGRMSYLEHEYPSTHKKIINASEGLKGYRYTDGTFIARVMRECGITIPIIGISGNSMKSQTIHAAYDLGKDNMQSLPDTIYTVLNAG